MQKIRRKTMRISLKRCYLLREANFNISNGQNGFVLDKEEFERRFKMPRLIYNHDSKEILEIERLFSEGKDCVGNVFSTTE